MRANSSDGGMPRSPHPSRLPPQAIDLEFLRWLEECALPYALVFTKTDKQSAARSRTNIDTFKTALAAWRSEPPVILISSSRTRAGRAEILAHISATLAAGFSPSS